MTIDALEKSKLVPPNSRALELLVFVLLLVLIALCYRDIINHRFLNWDDVLFVAENRHLHSLSLDNLLWMFTATSGVPNWHPLTWLSFSIDFSLWGSNPVGFKLSNLILHALGSFAVFVFFKNLLAYIHTQTRDRLVNFPPRQQLLLAALAACLFAIHTQHVESVIWISERKDLLCALFYFAALNCYLQYRRTDNSRYLLWVNLLALAAILSKPMAISLPVVLILFDVLLFNSHKQVHTPRQVIALLVENKLFLWLLSVFIGLMTLYMQQRFMKPLASVDWDTRLINALSSLMHYFYTIVYPEKLVPFYPYDEWSLSPGWYSLIPILLVTTFIGLSFHLGRYSRLFPLSLMFMLISSLPIIGVVSVGHQAAADRYTYIPTLFYYIILVALLMHAAKKIHPRGQSAITVVAGSLFMIYIGYQSVDYTRSWRDDLSLWARTTEVYPMRSTLAHSNLGNSWYIKGDYSKAIAEYQKALTIGDTSPDLYQRLAMAYFERGQKKPIAYGYFHTALSMSEATEDNYTVAINYYIKNRDLTHAHKVLSRALTLYPDSIYLLMLSAKMELNLGNANMAIRALQTVLRLDATLVDAHLILADIYIKQNRYTEAKKHVDRAVKLNPVSKPAQQLQKYISASTNRAS